ncbi:MAG: hypothetical protein ABFC12_02525 [Methanobacterium sp.]
MHIPCFKTWKIKQTSGNVLLTVNPTESMVSGQFLEKFTENSPEEQKMMLRSEKFGKLY